MFSIVQFLKVTRALANTLPQQLVSSKFLTTFSDFRLPKEAADFVTPAVYVQYLKDYAAKFGLLDLINLNSPVSSIRRGPGGKGHVVVINKPHEADYEWECDAVAICTGLHVTPRMPEIIGMENVKTVLHSSQLKSRDQFGKDTEVVVLGGGETGMDIAHLAITSPTKSVTICHRAGFYCAPKVNCC